jgi:hypothetical protein
MTRTIARTRHPLSRPLIVALRPLFRYSRGREAYVLRGVGRHFGPVLVSRTRGEHPRAGDPVSPAPPPVAAEPRHGPRWRR